MMRPLSLVIGIVVVLSCASARAWVDIKNANFSMTRTDFEVKESGPDLLLERTYNSRSSDSGFFGRGWCSNVESKITVIAKGLVVFQRCGSGRAKIFKSPSYDAMADEAALDELVKLVGEKMDRNAKIPNGFRQILKNDIEVRAMFIRNYEVTRSMQDGERFQLSNFPEATEVTYSKSEFSMLEEDGDVFVFDLSGSLKRISSRVGQTLKLEWEKSKLKSIADVHGNRISFSIDSAGHVAEARGPNRQFKYKYSNDGDLVEVDSKLGKETYAYDSDHNLTAFNWGKVAIRAKYDTKNDRVVEVVSDCTRKYRYDVKTSDKTMSVDLDTTCPNRKRETVKYDFKFKESKSGQLFQSEMTATDAENRRTAVRYGDDNRPIWMERKGVVTEFAYDGKGRLSKVTNPEGSAEYSYDDRGRLAVFTSIKKKGGAAKRREIRYSYADDGSLASTTEGAVVTKFTYDGQGRLKGVSNTRGNTVEIRHRSPASVQPSEIKTSKNGKIDLNFGTTGALVPPRDEAGLSKFIAVMTAYQELVEPGSEIFKKVSEP